VKTVFAIALLAATLAAAAQSQQPPQGSCDGEPNKADCVVLFELCNANSPPGDPNYSYCVNDAAACLLHYDATLCAAINKNRATENIAHNWQFCVGTAATKADADMCNAPVHRLQAGVREGLERVSPHGEGRGAPTVDPRQGRGV
jgi:hypothetical protein